MGADFAYIGSAFIATDEANANAAYKQAVVDGSSDDIVHSSYFTGIPGNYLARSIRTAGMDPDRLPAGRPEDMNFGSGPDAVKVWRDIWGRTGHWRSRRNRTCPHLVQRLSREYREALASLPRE